MKHTKVFFTLLVLAAALLAFGCTSAGAGFSPTAAMWGEYSNLVSEIQIAATGSNVSAEEIKNKVTAKNNGTVLKDKAKLVDTQETADVKKIENTEKAKKALEEQLKKRFVLVPIQ